MSIELIPPITGSKMLGRSLVYHRFIDEGGMLDLNGIWVYGDNPVIIAKSNIFHDTSRYLIGCLDGDLMGYLEKLGCPADFRDSTDLVKVFGKYGERNRSTNRYLCSNGDECTLDDHKMIKLSPNHLEYIDISGRTPIVVKHVHNGIYPLEIWNKSDWETLKAARLLH